MFGTGQQLGLNFWATNIIKFQIALLLYYAVVINTGIFHLSILTPEVTRCRHQFLLRNQYHMSLADFMRFLYYLWYACDVPFLCNLSMKHIYISNSHKWKSENEFGAFITICKTSMLIFPNVIEHCRIYFTKLWLQYPVIAYTMLRHALIDGFLPSAG